MKAPSGPRPSSAARSPNTGSEERALASDGVKKVLLGVTGSVAAVKTSEIVQSLRGLGHEVIVAATGPSLAFFDPETLGALPETELPPGRVHPGLYLDEDEWPVDRRFLVGEPVLHIEFRRWADLLLIAPLDANTLAKLSLGLCDNLLTCVYRAWDLQRPVLLAPAMNTMMWEHPATRRHLRQLAEDHGGAVDAEGTDALELCDQINRTCPRLRIIPPVSKRLACGDQGVGGMAPVDEIAQAVSLNTGPPEHLTT